MNFKHKIIQEMCIYLAIFGMKNEEQFANKKISKLDVS